jgi:integrase
MKAGSAMFNRVVTPATASRRRIRERIKKARQVLGTPTTPAPGACDGISPAPLERLDAISVPSSAFTVWKRPANRTSLFDAFTQAISARDCSQEHKANQELEAAAMLDFMEGLGVRSCADLRTAHIAAYVSSLREAGYATTTLRHKTNPVRIINSWMLTQFEKTPVAVQQHLPKRRGRSDVVFLNQEQLRLAYRVAGQRGFRQAQLLIVLAGCAGLRLTEVMRLQPGDLTADNVLSVGIHGAKNLPSVRCIPVADFVARELREFWADGVHSFPTRFAWSCQIRWTFEAVCLIADLSEDDREVFSRATAKDLRKSVANIVRGEAARDEIRAYYGHSTADMLARFYEVLTPKPEQPSGVRAAAVGRLRSIVVDAIDTAFPAGIK